MYQSRLYCKNIMNTITRSDRTKIEKFDRTKTNKNWNGFVMFVLLPYRLVEKQTANARNGNLVAVKTK